jgi:hypothetical protein
MARLKIVHGIPLDARTVEGLSGFAEEFGEKIEFMD